MPDTYRFLFFSTGPHAVVELREMASPSEARVRAASELLATPWRRRVEVWRGPDLVYVRQR